MKQSLSDKRKAATPYLTGMLPDEGKKGSFSVSTQNHRKLRFTTKRISKNLTKKESLTR
jgi:hypothetical protein